MVLQKERKEPKNKSASARFQAAAAALTSVSQIGVLFSWPLAPKKREDDMEQNYYAVIPLFVLENPKLTPVAKLLYGEISSLTRKGRVCFAGNRYLAARMGTSERTIQRTLKELQDADHVSVSYQNPVSCAGRTIKIKIEDDTPPTPVTLPATDMTPPCDTDDAPPHAINGAPTYRVNEVIDKSTEPAPKAAPGVTSPLPIKEFTGFYCKEYLERFKEKYHYSGAKDTLIIKRLLKVYGLDELKKMAVAFFESNDKWIKSTGYTLGVFNGTINKVKLDKKSGASLLQRERSGAYVVTKKSLI